MATSYQHLLEYPLEAFFISFVVTFFIFALFFKKLLTKITALDSTLLLQQTALVELNEKLAQSGELNKHYLHNIQQQLTAGHQQFATHQQTLKAHVEQQISGVKVDLLQQQHNHAEKQSQLFQQHHQTFTKNQLASIDQIIEHLTKTTQLNREELSKSLQQSSESIAQRFDALTQSTDQKLQEISGQVEKRLAEGFDKTTQTFNDILKRLVLIDDAQKKITELSVNVVSLQDVLADKRSRGAFGEVQLNSLIRNVLPEQHFSIQHTLSNGKIADCLLYLPAPTGNVVIDSKFPLESYRKMTDISKAESDRKSAERQFKQDIKKHINDISAKYLIENETSDGAIMFIPAEAIFAEIHAHQSDLVDYANKQRVWLASPTTLMAILTTARSVLKDEATREQIHIIQAHLSELGQDFSRFRTRFDNLAKHIDQAATDVKQIHTSAHKISTRFTKIEQVELNHKNNAESELEKI